MGVLDWVRRRKKPSGIKKLKEEEAPSVDEEKKTLERTRKLQTEIEEHMKKEQNKRKSEKDAHEEIEKRKKKKRRSG